MHVAAPAHVVKFGAAVHSTAIIPHHEVADAPAMGVNELALGGVSSKFTQECLDLLVRQACDATNVQIDVERDSAGLGDGALPLSCVKSSSVTGTPNWSSGPGESAWRRQVPLRRDKDFRNSKPIGSAKTYTSLGSATSQRHG